MKKLTVKKLTGRQRKFLRGLAHGLKPVVQIGKGGLSDSLLESLDEALDHHELIKIKFLDWKNQKLEICDEIDSRLGSEHVGSIGHVAIFYRAAKEPEARLIRLPSAA